MISHSNSKNPLNKYLHAGNNFQNSLVGVLLRCQNYKIALVADLETMFHQGQVPTSDMDFLIFLCAEYSFKSQRIDTFQMAVLKFGATDSAFANYALTSVGRPRREFSSAMIETILKSFYEGKLLKCVVTKQESIDLAKELKIDRFRTTKFWSNDEDAVKCVTDSEKNKSYQKNSF